MAITKSAKIQAEIEKVKAKIVEQQTRLKELAVVGIGGGAGWYFKIYRPKKQRAAESEENYGGEYDAFDGAAYDEIDPEDDTPPWDEDGEE